MIIKHEVFRHDVGASRHGWRRNLRVEMLSALNTTINSGLALLTRPGGVSQETPASAASATQLDGANSGSPKPTGFSSVDQIFSILKAAQAQKLASSAVSVTAEAAYSSQMADATLSVGVSFSLSAPGAAQQIAAAVLQVNALIGGINPGDLSDPARLPAQSANVNDAVNVTLGDGTGALTLTQGLGLPGGLAAPTTIAQALGQLSQSSVAGVAAAASSLLSRLIPSEDGKSAGFMATAGEIAVANLSGRSLDTPEGMALFMTSDWRDDTVYSLALSMIGVLPRLDEAAQASEAQDLANTYNGSFTLVKAPYVPATTDMYKNNGVSGWVEFNGSPSDLWYVVFPQPTVTATVTAGTTTADSIGK